jgi:hypothetical protein
VIGEERAGRGTSRIDAVECAHLPARRREIATDQVSNQERQRTTHQCRDGNEHGDRHHITGEIGGRGEVVPAVGGLRVGRNGRRECTQVGKRGRNEESAGGDREFAISVGSPENPGGARVSPVGPDASDVASDPEPGHEHGNHERGRIDGVAEDVAEFAYPDDLVDQATRAREKEEHVQENVHVVRLANTSRASLRLHADGTAPVAIRAILDSLAGVRRAPRSPAPRRHDGASRRRDAGLTDRGACVAVCSQRRRPAPRDSQIPASSAPCHGTPAEGVYKCRTTCRCRCESLDASPSQCPVSWGR